MSFHPARFATEEADFRPALPCVILSGITEIRMSKSYFEKLKDPRWQRKRIETLEAAAFSCQSCGDDESTLHVHHKQYFKGREPWEYDVEQLAVLCESCHAAHHEAEDVLLLVASRVPMDGPRGRETAASLLAGFVGLSMGGTPSPDDYLRGRLVDAIPPPWRSSLRALDVFELEKLIDAIHTDPTGFSEHLRAFIGTTWAEPKGFCVA